MTAQSVQSRRAMHELQRGGVAHQGSKATPLTQELCPWQQATTHRSAGAGGGGRGGAGQGCVHCEAANSRPQARCEHSACLTILVVTLAVKA